MCGWPQEGPSEVWTNVHPSDHSERTPPPAFTRLAHFLNAQASFLGEVGTYPGVCP